MLEYSTQKYLLKDLIRSTEFRLGICEDNLAEVKSKIKALKREMSELDKQLKLIQNV